MLLSVLKIIKVISEARSTLVKKENSFTAADPFYFFAPRLSYGVSLVRRL